MAMHARQIVVPGVVMVTALTFAVVILSASVAGGPGAQPPRAVSARAETAATSATTTGPSTTIGTAPDGCINGLNGAATTACQAFSAQQSQQNATLYPATGTVISAHQAIADATEPADPDETGATFDAMEMTYAKAAHYMETGNPNLSLTMPVYIVTAHLATPQNIEMGPTDLYDTSYTSISVLENAVTGEAIDSCSGCDIVRPGNTAVSALG